MLATLSRLLHFTRRLSRQAPYLPGWLAFALLLPAGGQASVLSPAHQPLQPDPEARAIFTATYNELRRGQLTELQATLERLQDYPLAPYLEYQWFRNQVAYRTVNPEQLHAFLARYPDSSFHARLRDEWLEFLGQERQWHTFLQVTNQHGKPTSTRLQCYQLRAEAEVHGQSLSWLDQSASFWRDNQPLPSSCGALGDTLQLLGLLTAADYRQATLDLMRNRQTAQAWAFRQRLSATDQDWLEFWRSARQNPAQRLQALLDRRIRLDATPAELRDELLVDVLQQHGRTHPTQAHQLVQQLTRARLLSETAGQAVFDHLAIRAAWRNQDSTLELFAQVPADARSLEGREWYARTLLRQARWTELITAIAALDASQQQRHEWRYWLAHALQQTDQAETATPLLQELASHRNYYGFLAARQLGIAPQMNARDVPLDPPRLLALSQQDGLIRAAELYFTGFTEDASREWLYTLRDAGPDDWIQAGWLAYHWGWYNRSVDAANRAGLEDALDLRFPLAHLDTLQPLAQQADIELPLILALIRKESLFNPEARSSVGALGLMQVMPATGQQVSRQLQLGLRPEADLLKPEHNLPVGVHYLSGLLQRYDQDPVLAAAAYNAGPTRANAWRSSLGTNTDPLWVERITFAETRDYVKSLLAFREVYAWRLQQEQDRQARLNGNKQPEG